LYSCSRSRSAVHPVLTLLRSYFQCGVSNFLLGRYELAFKDFEDALLYLRGNQAINYEQLGLKFRLYSAEVLFNKGLCLVYLGNQDDGLQDMRDAQKEKATDEHNVIDEAITDGGEGYTVFSIVSSYPPPAFLRTHPPYSHLYSPLESFTDLQRTRSKMQSQRTTSDARNSWPSTTRTTHTRPSQA
jgi:tetratricopeptide (TPR) repeat protein